ncbi:MAG: MBL fold metallo-hydrolase [Actinobacteria bacterium]|jgi:alkyl sulfatase BDS1-like metallo-beta-lactamase superfamily hydrolase|nr:MBL fold metallo-hydrolase [Actinomycetota bacterium]
MSDLDPRAAKPATPHTASVNAAFAASLRLEDDWERATRGLIAQHESGEIEGPLGLSWNTNDWNFLREQEDPPESVNPSLWRHGRHNAIHGLFEVAENIWQARGYDISNITFIKGDEGWVIVDPLTTSFTAKACLDLANATLGERPVTTVLYTHSHTDHYGGILGVTSTDEVDKGNVRILAPEGFMREAVAENLIAGPAMGRRAFYQFGMLLQPGPQGHIDCGLGKWIPRAQPDLVAPTEEIALTGTELVLDGVRVVFQNTPGTEAPAEMNFMFPDLGALCIAENCTHTMHNTLPFRGAQARDTLSWSKYIQEALDLFGGGMDVLFSTHNWPRFGRDDAVRYLELQRDMYRWLHDQTMRRANHGMTMREIAEDLQQPECFATQSHTRGYYGTVSHNAKAVYQRYIGWYDGNPANLNPHTPEESGRRYVDAMGGPDQVHAEAKRAFDEGDYRWAAELLNHLVFADPTYEPGRLLQADTFEQLGYQSESGPWRDSYLMGAMELRTGNKGFPMGVARSITDQLDVDMLVELIGIRLQAENVEGESFESNWYFSDINEHHAIGLDNCAIHHRPGATIEGAPSITCTKAALADAVKGAVDVDGFLAIEGVSASDDGPVRMLFENLDQFSSEFGIVEP